MIKPPFAKRRITLKEIENFNLLMSPFVNDKTNVGKTFATEVLARKWSGESVPRGFLADAKRIKKSLEASGEWGAD